MHRPFMVRHEHLPIYHAAMRMSIALKRAVALFPRYLKCALGAELIGAFKRLIEKPMGMLA